MEKDVLILIKEMEENGEKYYLATSPDLFGLVVETDNLQEMMNIVPQIANDLIEANNQSATPQGSDDVFERWTNVKYTVLYKPQQVYSLEYAHMMNKDRVRATQRRQEVDEAMENGTSYESMDALFADAFTS